VGVILFQALTGKLPHTGQLAELFARKAAEAIPRPRKLDASIPEDLDEICHILLDRRPDRRATAAAMLTTSSMPIVNPCNSEMTVKDCFVGRAEQLTSLNTAFSETLQGKMSIVLIEGPSGIGKTALVERFLALLTTSHAEVVTLKGRCYEFESVPYKGLDNLLDELSLRLQRLPTANAEALLPRDAFLLPRLFPVLGRVKAITSSPARSAVVPDAQELRQRTFAALRELLARLADRHPLLIWIDDLQWGDRDSVTFLTDLCAPPLQPPVLLLLTYRSEELSSNSTLQYLNRVLTSQKVSGNLRHVALGHLGSEESRELLEGLLVESSTIASRVLQAKILAEANGHPFFLQQLVRFAASRPASALETAASPDFDLSTVLQSRIEGLPEFTRDTLAFVCIAAQPLSTSILFRAARYGQADERAEALALLARERFVRISGIGPERRVEPFHDQMRVATVRMLTASTCREKHATLARTLAAEPDTEPQILLTHYEQAGDTRATYDAALHAGESAEHQLAFDRAAVCYEAALKTGEASPAAKAALYRRLADALAKAGRGRDSANAYLRAAQSEAENDPLRMKRLAMDQLMRSGYIDDAMALFVELAKVAGIRTPQTPVHSILAIMWARVQARAHLLMGLPKPSLKPPSVRDLARLQVLHTGSVVLNIVDPVRAAYFQVQYILEALRVREPVHLATALAFEASARIAGGTSRPQIAYLLLDKAERMAVEIDNPNLVGFIYLARAYVDYLLGRIPDGIIHSRNAVGFLRERCTGVAWELTASYVLLFYFLSWAGRVQEVSELLPQLMKEGTARGDINMEASLMLVSYSHLAYVSANRAEDYLRERARCLQLWSREGIHLQHYGALVGLVETLLYMGDYTRAQRELLTNWDVLSRSFILRWQILRIMVLFLRGRVAVARLLDEPQDRSLRSELRICIKQLERIRSPWSLPMTHLLRAGLAAADSKRDDAMRYLEAAYQGFNGISLNAYAAASQYHCGMLRSGEWGRKLVDEASRFFLEQNVKDLKGVVRMLVPGKWN
jgi:tetratricopeptide (TPR) repeat protein